MNSRKYNPLVKLALTAITALSLSACSNDTTDITDLCRAQGKSFIHCSCYVDILGSALSEDHLAMLAKMARHQLSDGMDESQARDALLKKHGRYTVTQFLNAFISPKNEAELSCPQ